MSKEVTLKEMFESIQRDIDRGYPDYENFEPTHCRVGTIYPVHIEAAEQSVQPTPSGRGGSAGKRVRKSKVGLPA